MQTLYAPGIRVGIRDFEWIVRMANPSDDGGYIFTVDGLSELVSGKSTRILTTREEAENATRVIKPNETHCDQVGHIVFPPIKGLVGVVLPRKAKSAELKDGIHYAIQSPERKEEGIALGWEDIQHLQQDRVYKTIMDDTLPPAKGFPSGTVERTVVYKAPFFKPDREEYYRVAWEIFANE